MRTQDGLFARLFRRKQPPSSGWERTLPTEDTRTRIRETNTEDIPIQVPPAVPYPLHQPPAHPRVIPARIWTEMYGLPPVTIPRTSTTGPIALPPTSIERLPTLPARPGLKKVHVQLVEHYTPPTLPDWMTQAMPLENAPLPANVAGIQYWAGDEQPKQETSALEQLEMLAAAPPDEDTVEVPAMMKKQRKQEQK